MYFDDKDLSSRHAFDFDSRIWLVGNGVKRLWTELS